MFLFPEYREYVIHFIKDVLEFILKESAHLQVFHNCQGWKCILFLWHKSHAFGHDIMCGHTCNVLPFKKYTTTPGR